MTTSPTTTFELRVLEGPALPALTLTGSEPMLIGRGAGAVLVLDSRSVSRKHAEVRPMDFGWVIVDLNSKNGTQINDVALEPQTPAPLLEGDTLRIGKWLLGVTVRAAR